MWQIKTECTGEEQVYDLQSMDSKLVRLCINLREDNTLKEYVMPLLHH